MKIFYLVVVLFFFSSCSALQYRTDFPIVSKFINFKSLGITKEDLIKEYGNPISTGISKSAGEISEILYYAEKLKDFIVTTEFIFKNNKLNEMRILKVENNYQNDLEDIKWQTEINSFK